MEKIKTTPGTSNTAHFMKRAYYHDMGLGKTFTGSKIN